MSDVISRFTAAGAEEYAADVSKMADATDELTQSTKQAEAAQKSFRTQAREMREALTALAVAGKQNTEEYKKLRDEAGRLNDAMGDVNDELRQAGSDTRGLDKALRATSVLVGGFTAVQGAAALFGNESEDLQKTLLKVNAAMSILNGLQAIQTELLKPDSLLTAAATKAKLAYAAAVGASTGALKIFRIALAATGIGLFVIAVGTLAANWDRVKKAITDAFPALGRVGEFFGSFRAFFVGTGAAAVEFFRSLGDGFASLLDRDFKGAINAIRTLPTDMKAAFVKGVDDTKKAAAEEAQKAKEAGKITGKAIGDGIKEGIKESLGAANSQAVADATIAALEKELKTIDATTNAYRDLKEQIALLREEYELLFNTNRDVQTGLNEISDSQNVVIDNEDERLKKMQEVVQLAQDSRPAIIERYETEEQRLRRILDLMGKIQVYTSLLNQSAQQGTAIAKQAIDTRAANEIKALEDKKNAGIINEKQYQRELAKIQNAAARKKRKADIAMAVAMIPQAVLSAFTQTTGGLIVKSIAAAIAGAFAVAQVALIAKAPLPQFRTGVIDLKGPGTATSDSITARLSKGESVMTAAETRIHRDALLAMRGNEFQKKYVPVADVPKLMSQRKRHTYYPTPLDKVSTASDQRLIQKIDELILETKFHSQYTKQGNSADFKSLDQLKSISDKITRRGFRT